MNKKSASIFLAIVLDIVFASLFFFYLTKNQSEQITLHMNQVGIYDNETDSQQMVNQLKEYGIEAYFYALDDLYLVVTTPTSNLETCLEEQKILDKNKIAYLLKEVSSKDEQFVMAVKQHNIQKVLEVMSHQSSRNE